MNVQHYAAELKLDPVSRYIEGEMKIRVDHSDTLKWLPLSLESLEVISASIGGKEITPRRHGSKLLLPLPMSATKSDVILTYNGIPSTGLYVEEYAGQRVLFTDSWPDRGSGWLPAFHHPSDPATFSLSLEIPLGYEAVASGTESGIDTLASTVLYNWNLSAPAPTYTFAFAVADFSVLTDSSSNTVPVRHYVLAGDEEWTGDLRRIPQVLDFYSDLIGPYAYETFSSVEVPFKFAGMENASAAFLQARIYRKGAIESVAVHEIAHQWFGNQVVISDWRDLWLSEGMATYLSTLFYDAIDGREEGRELWIKMSSYSPSIVPRKAPLVPETVTDPYDQLTWVPYKKGASVLHLIRLKLGDEAFFGALRQAYSDFAGRALDTGAFLEILESQCDQELDDFFDFWVYGGFLPVLHTTWTPQAGRLQWDISGDHGTLSGIPFQLVLSQGKRTQIVDVCDGQTIVSGWTEAKPDVYPVGVMLRVE